MAANSVFDDFRWHSATGLDAALSGAENVVVRLPYNARVASMFVAAGNDMLIHKTTKCLWKMSKDKKAIEPVFNNDILSEDDVKKVMSD